MIRDQHYWVRSNAVLQIIALLPMAWRPLQLLRVLPRVLRDWAYDRIARNRYRLLAGTTAACCPILIMRNAS